MQDNPATLDLTPAAQATVGVIAALAVYMKSRTEFGDSYGGRSGAGGGMLSPLTGGVAWLRSKFSGMAAFKASAWSCVLRPL